MASTPTAAKPVSNESIIYGFLKSKGLTPAQIAGVLGNLQVESGFRTDAYNPGEGAIGIAQWEGGRRTNLQAYARARGLTETNLSAQLGYLWTELTGSYPGAYAHLRAATTPGQAATVWDAEFEVSSGEARGQRINFANSIFQSIQSGTLKPGTGSGAAGLAGSDSKKVGPYDPKSLKAPLTADQRRRIVAWILSLKVSGKVTNTPSQNQLQTMGDAALIKIYAGFYYIANYDPPITGPEKAIKDGISEAVNGWVQPVLTFVGNGALIVFGLIAVIVALVVLAKSSGAGSSPSPSSPPAAAAGGASRGRPSAPKAAPKSKTAGAAETAAEL